MSKEVIRKIEKRFSQNQQYLRLGCLYDNRLKETCRNCTESENGCREMLRAFKYPPYEND